MTKVFYHWPCIDGLASAWVARRALNLKKEDLIGLSHDSFGQLDISKIGIARLETVYFLDIAPPAILLKNCEDNFLKVIVVDHHQTAKREIGNWNGKNFKLVFDDRCSGATLTWEHFFSNVEFPKFLKLIEAMDLGVSDNLPLSTDEFIKLQRAFDQIDLFNQDAAFMLFDALATCTWDDILRKFSSSQQASPTVNFQELEVFDFSLERICPHPVSKTAKAVIVDMECYGREITPWLLSYSSSEVIVGIHFLQEKVRLNFRSTGSVDVSILVEEAARYLSASGGGRANAAVLRLDRSKFFDLFPEWAMSGLPATYSHAPHNLPKFRRKYPRPGSPPAP